MSTLLEIFRNLNAGRLHLKPCRDGHRQMRGSVGHAAPGETQIPLQEWFDKKSLCIRMMIWGNPVGKTHSKACKK